MNKGVFLVTGGSRGIGEAVAMAAAGAGYWVLLTYASNAQRAAAVVARIRAAGGWAEALLANTGVEADIDRVFDAVDAHGGLDVLVCNAAITGAHSPLVEASTATIDEVLGVNLRGAILCARSAARRMGTSRGGQGGSIVFVSSRAAFYGSPGEYVWYAASKGGVDSLTNGLSRELAPEGIRVNAVSPGPIDTEMHRPGRLEVGASRSPLARAGTPAEVAQAVMFLVSPAASYITGANAPVAGGL